MERLRSRQPKRTFRAWHSRRGAGEYTDTLPFILPHFPQNNNGARGAFFGSGLRFQGIFPAVGKKRAGCSRPSVVPMSGKKTRQAAREDYQREATKEKEDHQRGKPPREKNTQSPKKQSPEGNSMGLFF